MGKKIDLTGREFGELRVIAEHSERKNKKIYWVCKCSCGTEKLISGSDLKSGKIKSCGCLKTEILKSKEMIGKRFNRLVVIEETKQRKDSQIVWKCQCDCGNTVLVKTGHLKTGGVSSCGCLKKERDGQTIKKDLINQKFGLLTVLRETGERKSNRVVWECQCECGNLIKVSSDSLVRGYRLSCGCLKESYGIKQIKELLTSNNFNFTTEKTFETCVFPETQGILRFDIWVNNSYLVEYDGEQHYKYTINPKVKTWNNEKHFIELQKRDIFKNEWCKKNNIPLIRIPYYIKDIKIEDLCLETTKYRVV